MSVQDRLNRIWYDGAAGQAALAPLSWMYGRLAASRRDAFVSGRAPAVRVGCPVVIVGNLSVGAPVRPRWWRG